MFPFNEVSQGAQHKKQEVVASIGRIFAIGTILRISDNIRKNTVIFKKKQYHLRISTNISQYMDSKNFLKFFWILWNLQKSWKILKYSVQHYEISKKWIFVKILEYLPKFWKILKNTAVFFWIFSDNTEKYWQNISEYTGIFRNICQYFPVFSKIRKYSSAYCFIRRIFRNILSDYPLFYGIFTVFSRIFKNIREYPGIYHDISVFFQNFSVFLGGK